jgi:hypothetical protein
MQPAQIFFVSPKGYALVTLAGSGELAFVPQQLMSKVGRSSGDLVQVATTQGSKGPIVTEIAPAEKAKEPEAALDLDKPDGTVV